MRKFRNYNELAFKNGIIAEKTKSTFTWILLGF